MNTFIEILKHMLEHGFFYNRAFQGDVIFLPIQYTGPELTKSDLQEILAALENLKPALGENDARETLDQ